MYTPGTFKWVGRFGRLFVFDFRFPFAGGHDGRRARPDDASNHRPSLAIPTADVDAERIARLIRAHAHQIDRIVVTLDSHQRMHIAHAIFWVNDEGEHPPPFTLITSDDVAAGTWRAADQSKQRAGSSGSSAHSRDEVQSVPREF
jgi:hypothetical protein